MEKINVALLIVGVVFGILIHRFFIIPITIQSLPTTICHFCEWDTTRRDIRKRKCERINRRRVR